jgi:imidazolonepropionase-like amidohydrolase
MSKTVLICARLFDGLSDTLAGPTEILIENNIIADIAQAVGRPASATVIDLGDRTVMPGFIDTHVHLCLDGLNLHQQVLQCSATKAMGEGCKQAMRAGVRSLERCYLIDDEGIAMAEQSGVFLVPTMQMTREDKAMLKAGKLPMQATWKFRRDVDEIERAQKRIATSRVQVSYGTDCGMFPFDHGILEFQAMVAAGLTPVRALKAATSVAASLLERDDIGVLAAGKQADIVAMPGDPVANIAVTEKGRLRHESWTYLPASGF